MWRVDHSSEMNPSRGCRGAVPSLSPRHFRTIILLSALLIMFAASAVAGQMWHENYGWEATGPGGSYGIVELKGMPTLPGGHISWATHFGVGPLQFSLPLRLPFAVCVVVAGLGLSCWLIFCVVSWFKKDHIPQEST